LYRHRVRFLLRVVLNAVGVLLAARIIPGIYITGASAALLGGIVLGVVNAIVRPILIVLTLPITVFTLGLFLLVINAVCLKLAARLVPGFAVTSWQAALFGSIFISLVSWALGALLADKRRD
jgi:putative membrane protein